MNEIFNDDLKLLNKNDLKVELCFYPAIYLVKNYILHDLPRKDRITANQKIKEKDQVNFLH